MIIASSDLAPYIAAKGSIALDGVSLTVNEVEASGDGGDGVCFGVNIIPHTVEKTCFSEVAPGRLVNIEIDILARYLGRLMELRK
jgi:riboflavin synthase